MSNSTLVGAYTVGIVVTHNPTHLFESTLSALVPQVYEVVIVDNASAPQNLDYIRGAASRHRCHVISNPENYGVGTALNQGVEWALSRGRSWALLLDQDTQLHDHALASLAALRESHPERDSLAIVAANFVDRATRALVLKPPASLERPWFPTTGTITSGSLLSLSAYKEIGPFRDEFFIDHVDIEYCLRAKRRGFKIIVSTAPLMIHSIGTGVVNTFLGVRTRTSNHSPIRRYYVTRNCIVLAKEYWRSDLRYVAYLLRQLLKTMILVMVFEGQKGDKLLHALFGLWDGLRGRLGPYGRTVPPRVISRDGDR